MAWLVRGTLINRYCGESAALVAPTAVRGHKGGGNRVAATDGRLTAGRVRGNAVNDIRK